ncbi:hypothetical protein [Aureibacter tunicatorum]|uniref:Lipoxygenase domain-containing protein n=1 Tax=Aureibacter tunicatorum TaxID=866807 RepID=A0AAE3XLV6_9BACT|nr:hypothetical protein [Aureibacter tunicatorum]MDR6238171.1 hypothetical protein [Aureibacter tunicatorum]BDD03204.1 hypothetical protein AUTU_06870 [Aureibacter tunicatorum]
MNISEDIIELDAEIQNRLNIEAKALTKEKYLYERKGPWPQPSPEHPLGEAPAVLHLPKKEKSKWRWNIGLRYFRNMITYWPVALAYTFKNPTIDKVSDEEFNYIMTEESYSKFLHTCIDKDKRDAFAEYMTDENGEYFIIDLTLIKHIIPLKDMYASPTVALFKTNPKNKKKEVVAILMLFNGLVLSPNDGKAWELAKYYTLQGATYKLVLSEHALLHFPFDCINAISKTTLPKDSLLFKLMNPHFEFTLALNISVLESPNSPIENHQFMPYSALVGKPEGFRNMLVSGYKGIEGNSCYPLYQYTLSPRKIHSDYGIFLQEYFDTFLRFVTKVVKKIPVEEYAQIKLWARHISKWIPEFPDEIEICDEKVLARAVTKVIWDVSIAHAADHYNYSTIKINKVPLRLRVKPPQSKKCDFEQKDLGKFVDIFKYKMIQKLFFKPTNVTLLKNTQYNFNSSELVTLNQEFLSDLRQTEQKLLNRGIKNFIPLDQISRSIQY